MLRGRQLQRSGAKNAWRGRGRSGGFTSSELLLHSYFNRVYLRFYIDTLALHINEKDCLSSASRLYGFSHLSRAR